MSTLSAVRQRAYPLPLLLEHCEAGTRPAASLMALFACAELPHRMPAMPAYV
jgi:hypothetical protein